MDNAKLIYGFHAINIRLQHNPKSIRALFVKENRHDKRVQQLSDRAKQQNISIDVVSSIFLDELAQNEHHQGVVAKIDPDNQPLTVSEVLANIQEIPLLVILDGVTDPHNLGACLRVAEAMGAQAVIAPKDNSAKITPIVSKVACGAAESVPYILVTNLVRAVQEIKKAGIKVSGLVIDGPINLFDCDASVAMAWVLGAENKGMRRLTRENCDELVKLPMFGLVESLNVSVCAGIILAETRRQRMKL